MNSHLGRAALVALVLVMVLGWTDVLGVRVLGALAGGIALALLLAAVAWLFRTRLDVLLAWVRERAWARQAGSYHAFGGTMLQIEDDGRHVWIAGPGLQRVLGRNEPDDVLAARLAGMSRRQDDGPLQLRVDAVVQYLAHMPERNDPRMQKFRRYLERDVLHPAAQRRQRR